MLRLEKHLREQGYADDAFFEEVAESAQQVASGVREAVLNSEVAAQRTFQIGISAVLGGVIRGGVRTEAVGLSFNQHGAFTGTDLLHGVAGCSQYGENVVAVNANTFKAVACGAVDTGTRDCTSKVPR